MYIKDYVPFITMEFAIPNAISKTSICLNMIVKNESHVIVETLENLCSYINFSYWVISDTGSTDNTKEVITSFFLAKNIPGEIVEHEWRDFGHNRSKALECAYNKTDYLLIFDADDRLIGDFKLPAVYDKDQYQLLFGTNFVYTRPLLINNRKKWCFKGVLHESLSSMEQVNGASIIEGNYHVMSGRTGARSQNPNKYIDDANILKKAHFDELKTDYNLSCRYAFYCAQSYKDAGVNYYDDAIEWYKKCLDLKMWVQEKFYGCLNIGLIYSYKKDYLNALKYWYKTIEYDPERIEGIIHAMNYLRNDGQHILINALYHKFKNYNKNLEGKLFLFKNVYNDELEYHNTISAFYIHDKKSGYECCKTIILNNTISSSLLKSTISNMQFYIDFLKDDCVSLNTNTDALKMFYVVDKIMGDMCCKNEQVETNMMNIWNILFEKSRPLLSAYSNYSFSNREKPQIIISFTTCKRLELFKQTIQSILNHWLDIDKIDYWFCVDDNSCEKDRNNMKTLYPWINYYMKNTEEKGHKHSMNIIWDKLNELKPTYWIHMEDDFLFHTKMNYVEEAIRGLRSGACVDAQVKQILFNKDYGETIEQYNSSGHVMNDDNNSIVIHDFKSGVFPYQNCHYWPHYSFRPSLTDVKTILELGNFDTEDTFFEMTYAKKWTTAGYKSGFFNKITNRHIGRLTINRGDKTSPNAYELNSEAQFYKPAATAEAAPEPSIKIINLERRTDRKEATIKKLSDVGINEDQYEFIKAVDGFALEPTIELKRLFNGNDFGSRKGFIGCALSHYDLWKRLLVDDKNDYYVIMEDDFSLCSHFKQKFMGLLPVFKEKEMLFMGYHMFEKNRQKVLDIYVDDPSYEIIKVEPLNKNLYIGGYFMYSINKKGAQICIDYIQRYGIKHGIDYIVKIMQNLSCFETQPHMAVSIWNEHGAPIDSDIQNIGDFFDFSKLAAPDLSGNNIYINGISGLGNNLFQIAVAIYYKEIYKNNNNNKNINIILNKTSECLQSGTGNKFGKNKLKTSYFNTILNKFNTANIVPECKHVLYNDCLSLNKIDLVAGENVLISGYCQNVDLFFDVREKLWDYFNLEDEAIKRPLAEKYKIDNNAINIMLGIRIGIDGGFKFSTFSKKSYKQAINAIIDSSLLRSAGATEIINIYVLSDVEDVYCMLDTSDKYNIICVNEDDISQMYVGVMCNHFILSDSTYHWWIAFLKWAKDPSVKVYVFNNTFIENRCLLNSTLKMEWTGIDLIPNDNFIFMKNVDHCGDDMFRNNVSLPMLIDRAEKESECVAFNTMGFFKNKVDIHTLKPSPYFDTDDGIYIKKEYYETNKKILLPKINSSLQELAEFFFLDKCNKYLHNYIPIYEKHLDERRNIITNIFEIGIGCIERNQMTHMSKYNYKTGNSLRAWKHYCKNANIYGIDIFEECLFEEPQIKTFICDQSNAAQLQGLMDKINVKMDLIVDDGSHVIEHQVISFMTLEKYLTDDGIYIIEDIWNHHFDQWKQLTCFPIQYVNYIKLKYDIFYYDQSSDKSNAVDCMCVFKQKINNRIRIKMLCNWTHSENLCKEWSNMCEDPVNFRWKNYQLVWSDNKDEIDYYVIINSPPRDAYFDPLKTIVFQMEPWVNDPTKNWGVKTWGQWAEPDPSKFLAVRGRKTTHHNNAFWQLELTYKELFEMDPVRNKQHTISSICSSKYFDEGHIARIDLLKYIEQKNDPNVQIDIYNADNNHNFINYKGPVSPYVDKSKGMLSYKYYFMMENNYEENFITEKIWEPILCESLVFYYGCPNVTDYIDARAFVLLDPNDFEKSYQIIKQAIEEDWWSQRIDVIRQEKRKILNELSFFPTIDKILMRCNNNITIIVARYNENVTWSKQFDNVIIYNKGEKLEDGYNEISLENVGREAPHILYIYL